MNIVFFGMEGFGSYVFRYLLSAGANIGAVVGTPSDRAKTFYIKDVPLAELAEKQGIPYYEPEDLEDKSFIDTLRNKAPDVILVATFDKIFSEELLRLPKTAVFNVHPSLLPDFRGATPITWIIMRGNNTAGVTVHVMEKRIDSGAVVCWKRIRIDPYDNDASLRRKLAHASGSCFLTLLKKIRKGALTYIPQEGGGAYYPKRTTKNAEIDWTLPAKAIFNLVRAMNPYPLAYTYAAGEKITIVDSDIFALGKEIKSCAGEIIEYYSNGSFAVATADRKMLLVWQAPQSKCQLSPGTFLGA